jgi:hypothetical protein
MHMQPYKWLCYGRDTDIRRDCQINKKQGRKEECKPEEDTEEKEDENVDVSIPTLSEAFGF